MLHFGFISLQFGFNLASLRFISLHVGFISLHVGLDLAWQEYAKHLGAFAEASICRNENGEEEVPARLWTRWDYHHYNIR
jgi:hypothetical protein